MSVTNKGQNSLCLILDEIYIYKKMLRSVILMSSKLVKAELSMILNLYLKPLQRNGWTTLNEKQSYLFTKTLIGFKLYIVRIIHNFF